jgi:O-antigen ligase
MPACKLAKRLTTLRRTLLFSRGRADPAGQPSDCDAHRLEAPSLPKALVLAQASGLLLRTEPVWAVGAATLVYLSVLGIISCYSWLGLLVAALPFAARWAYRGYPSRRTPFDWPIGLLLLAGLVGICASSDKGLSWRVYQSLLASVLCYYSLANYEHPRVLMRWGLLVAAIAVMLLGGYVFLQGPDIPSSPSTLPFFSQIKSWLHPDPQPSPSGWLSPPLAFNATGATIALEVVAVMIAGVALFPGRRADRMAAGIVVLFLLSLLLIATSNAAWPVLTIGLIVLLGWRSQRLLLSLPAWLGVALWSVSGRINRSVGPGLDMIGSKIELRWHRWDSVWQMIADSPISGVGLGGYPATYPEYRSEDLTNDLAHNAYLQFYSDFGLLGVLALIVAGAIFLRLACQIGRGHPDRPWKGIAVGAWVALLLAALYGTVESSPAAIVGLSENGYDYAISPLFGILGAALVVAHRGLLGGNGSRHKEGSTPGRGLRPGTSP